jgi:hypothetical protein
MNEIYSKEIKLKSIKKVEIIKGLNPIYKICGSV